MCVLQAIPVAVAESVHNHDLAAPDLVLANFLKQRTRLQGQGVGLQLLFHDSM